MAYRVIPIPGEKTTCEGCPQMTITGGGNSSLKLRITFNSCANAPDGGPLRCEVTFGGVLELRWIEHDVSYEEHPQHEEDGEFGLIEIIDSAYVETMASRGPMREYPKGNRFGHFAGESGGIPEADVRHFRIAFDDWGDLNVIALTVDVRAVTGQQPPMPLSNLTTSMQRGPAADLNDSSPAEGVRVADKPSWRSDDERRDFCRRKGIDPSQHCCLDMAWFISEPIEWDSQGPNPVIIWIAEWNEYFIELSHRGNSSTIIHFCPWCGTKLPDSRR